jgi:hypothetical protein
MTETELQTFLPTAHQKIAALILAVAAVFWIVQLMRSHRLREEHALLWLIPIVGMALVITFNPILLAVSFLIGTKVPASALLLLTIFFLFIICVWLTSILSIHKREIAKLMILVSILRSDIRRLEKESAQETQSDSTNSTNKDEFI